MKLTSPNVSTANLGSGRNLTPHEKISNVSMLDKKTRLFINVPPKTKDTTSRIKVEFSSCEYHDEFKEMNSNSNKNKDEFTTFTLSPTKISKLKSSNKLYAQIKKSTSSKGDKLLRVKTHNRFKSRIEEDTPSQTSFLLGKTEKTETSISNFLTTINAPAIENFSRSNLNEHSSPTRKYVKMNMRTEGSNDSRERDYSRFEKRFKK